MITQKNRLYCRNERVKIKKMRNPVIITAALRMFCVIKILNIFFTEEHSSLWKNYLLLLGIYV